MRKDEFKQLKRGDIVRNLGSGNSYLVADVLDGKVILIRMVVAENLDEWELVAVGGERAFLQKGHGSTMGGMTPTPPVYDEG